MYNLPLGNSQPGVSIWQVWVDQNHDSLYQEPFIHHLSRGKIHGRGNTISSISIIIIYIIYMYILCIYIYIYNYIYYIYWYINHIISYNYIISTKFLDWHYWHVCFSFIHWKISDCLADGPCCAVGESQSWKWLVGWHETNWVSRPKWGLLWRNPPDVRTNWI